MTDPITRSDAELVAKVAAGDPTALAELYDRHSDAIYRAAYRRVGDRQLAEEILQDTYLALWNRAELYDEQQGSLSAWLGTIARNRAIDRLRSSGRRPSPMPLSGFLGEDGTNDRALDQALGRGDLLGSGTTPLDPEAHVDSEELRVQVQDALQRIPALERRVLELAYFEELSQSEIATRLSWPLGTVKTRTRRGLLRLRVFLASAVDPDLMPSADLLATLEERDDAAGASLSMTPRGRAGAIDAPR